MVTGNRLDLVFGIVMLVLGILVVTGNLYLGPIVTVAAIALVIVGVLMLLKRLPGGTILAVVAIVLGVLLLVPAQTFGDAIKPILGVLHIVIGVLLIVFGALKILGK